MKHIDEGILSDRQFLVEFRENLDAPFVESGEASFVLECGCPQVSFQFFDGNGVFSGELYLVALDVSRECLANQTSKKPHQQSRTNCKHTDVFKHGEPVHGRRFYQTSLSAGGAHPYTVGLCKGGSWVSRTGRKVRVTDRGSTVTGEARSARHSVAYYRHPSAHPQERRQYEIQKSGPWCGRSRDSAWRRHRGRAFLQSREVDQETDRQPGACGEQRGGKGADAAVAGAAAGAHHAEGRLHPLQDTGRLRCFASRQRQPADQIQLPEMEYDRGAPQR